MGKHRKRKPHPKPVAALPTSRAGLLFRSRAFVVGLLPVIAIVLVTRVTLAEAYRVAALNGMNRLF